MGFRILKENVPFFLVDSIAATAGSVLVTARHYERHELTKEIRKGWGVVLQTKNKWQPSEEWKEIQKDEWGSKKPEDDKFDKRDIW